MHKIQLYSVLGARPQFIKAAPLSRVFAQCDVIDETLIHTGQHFDSAMSQVFFDELNIPNPRYNLDISGGGHGEMTGKMMSAVEEIMDNDKPDLVLVYGDTNSTLAGALVAAKLNIPVIHVEAGLRSNNREMPEEINRIVTDHVSELLLAPTHLAVRNLEEEGLGSKTILTGDVMMDATLLAADIAEKRSQILRELGVSEDNYVLTTIHRAENTGDVQKLNTLISYVREQAAGFPIVFPVHPRTEAQIRKLNIDLSGFNVISPIGYLDMIHLTRNATFVCTDSGGLQKECYFHRTPCITLRSETEWQETIDAGWNRLWQIPIFNPRSEIGEYGIGKAASIIRSAILERFC